MGCLEGVLPLALHVQLYTLQGLRDTVPLSLSQDISDLPDGESPDGQSPDLPVAPLYLQRRWARISRQYMHEYRKGATRTKLSYVSLNSARRLTPAIVTSDSRSRQQEAAMAALSSGM